MGYTLRSWTHPSTQEKRVYVNGGDVAFGDKLYIRQATSGGPHGNDDWDAKLYAEYFPSYVNLGFGTRPYDVALTIAARALEGLHDGLSRASFSDILYYVENQHD